LVADGSIKLRKKVNCKIIDKIGEKHFAGRSIRSFRDHYRGLVLQLRLERKLAGGRKRLAGKCSHCRIIFVERILTPLAPPPPTARKEGSNPEDDSPDDTDDDDTIIMPPNPPNPKKRPVAATTGKKKKAAPVDTPYVPFSPAQISTFQQVAYSRDGGSWIEVSVFTSGFVNTGEFKFELARNGTTCHILSKITYRPRTIGQE
jgi:hypothetical protein